MKAAIVTWITYNNYGSILQAYALQKEFEKFCEECVIISDKPIIDAKRIDNKQPVSIQWQNEKGIEHIAGLFRRYVLHPAAIPRRIQAILKNRVIVSRKKNYSDSQKLFTQFKNSRIHVLDVEKQSDYPLLNNDFDIFVCGSDQIWSMLPHNFDPYYFLKFVTKRKVSYATSIGSYRIEKKDESILKMLLGDFDEISLREKLTARQFETLLHRKTYWVVDPTLLHNSRFWRKMAIMPNIGKEYLLCYFLENKVWYFEYANELAKSKGLELILIPSSKDFAERKEMYNRPVGPREFVGLFHDASYVLTDSYHGSIFSLQFNKQFKYLKRFSDAEKYNQNIRVDSLFTELGIYDDVVVDDKSIDISNFDSVNYEFVNAKIDELRSYSTEFIKLSMES